MRDQAERQHRRVLGCRWLVWLDAAQRLDGVLLDLGRPRSRMRDQAERQHGRVLGLQLPWPGDTAQQLDGVLINLGRR